MFVLHVNQLQQLSMWRSAAILNLQNIDFSSRDSCQSTVGSHYASGYQMLLKLDDLRLRPRDITVFKVAAVRRLGFVMTSSFCIRQLYFRFLTLYYASHPIGAPSAP